jgi:hypothetical protein
MPQNNVRRGRFLVVAAEDLTGMEDRLVELTHSAGSPRVQLPTSNTSRNLFLLIQGDAAGSNVLVAPIEPESNFRVKAKGAGNPGDSLCLADVATAADKGKVRALPAAAATYRVFAVCEEAFADGGLALARVNGPDSVVVN